MYLDWKEERMGHGRASYRDTDMDIYFRDLDVGSGSDGEREGNRHRYTEGDHHASSPSRCIAPTLWFAAEEEAVPLFLMPSLDHHCHANALDDQQRESKRAEPPNQNQTKGRGCKPRASPKRDKPKAKKAFDHKASLRQLGDHGGGADWDASPQRTKRAGALSKPSKGTPSLRYLAQSPSRKNKGGNKKDSPTSLQFTCSPKKGKSALMKQTQRDLEGTYVNDETVFGIPHSIVVAMG